MNENTENNTGKHDEAELTEREKSELCLGCMECCRSLNFRVPNQREYINFYQKARGLECTEDGNHLIVSIPHSCPQLTRHGCSIYPDRPMFCRLYDGRKDKTVNCAWSRESVKG